MRKALPLFIGLLIIAGCTDNQATTADGTTKEKPIKTTQAKESFTNDNYKKLASSPDKYKGSPVELNGKIFNEVQEGEKQTGFQMWVDPKNSEGNTIVIYDGIGLGLKSNDFIKVTGKVEGSFEGENMMGAKLTVPRIIASKIEKVSAADVLAPTENTVQVDQTQTQHGIAITLEQIEFAKDETRVFVKVRNGSKAKASFYSFNAKLTQGSSQFEPENSFEANYPEVQSNLLPGIESSGVIAFKEIDYAANSCMVYLEIGSDDWNLNFKPYTFNVAW